MGNSDHRLDEHLDDGAGHAAAEPPHDVPHDVAIALLDEIEVNVNSIAGDLIADNELLGAVTVSFSEAEHIDHMLDLFTTSVDLFDVPAWDSDPSS